MGRDISFVAEVWRQGEWVVVGGEQKWQPGWISFNFGQERNYAFLDWLYDLDLREKERHQHAWSSWLTLAELQDALQAAMPAVIVSSLEFLDWMTVGKTPSRRPQTPPLPEDCLAPEQMASLILSGEASDSQRSWVYGISEWPFRHVWNSLAPLADLGPPELTRIRYSIDY